MVNKDVYISVCDWVTIQEKHTTTAIFRAGLQCG